MLREKLNPMPPQFESLMRVLQCLDELSRAREVLKLQRSAENRKRLSLALRMFGQTKKSHEEMITDRGGKYV